MPERAAACTLSAVHASRQLVNLFRRKSAACSRFAVVCSRLCPDSSPKRLLCSCPACARAHLPRVRHELVNICCSAWPSGHRERGLVLRSTCKGFGRDQLYLAGCRSHQHASTSIRLQHSLNVLLGCCQAARRTRWPRCRRAVVWTVEAAGRAPLLTTPRPRSRRRTQSLRCWGTWRPFGACWLRPCTCVPWV